MLEQITYVNHLNERFEFGKNGVYAKTSELRNYEWTVTKQNDRIGTLDRQISKRKLPVVIICDTADKAVAAKNRLYEVIEKDVLSMQYGKLIVGDFYMKCYITKSQKKEYLTSKRLLQLELTVTTDLPAWVKENRHVLRKSSESGIGGVNLDYPHDYAFDFKSDTGSERINNTSIASSAFRMIFYGACVDPEVEIGGHLYKVLGEVGEREYVTIDAVAKTIYLTKEDGTQVNWFNNRYRRSYVFEPLPSGTVNVFWGGVYGIDVITFDERSEPRWT